MMVTPLSARIAMGSGLGVLSGITLSNRDRARSPFEEVIFSFLGWGSLAGSLILLVGAGAEIVGAELNLPHMATPSPAEVGTNTAALITRPIPPDFSNAAARRAFDTTNFPTGF